MDNFSQNLIKNNKTVFITSPCIGCRYLNIYSLMDTCIKGAEVCDKWISYCKILNDINSRKTGESKGTGECK